MSVEPTTVPLPLLTPLPLSRRQKRYGAASAALLEEAGYVEEEHLLTGLGDIYTYDADGSMSVARSKVPYTTLLMVRRPADPDRFSGKVILEPVHRAGPWGITFGTCWQQFTTAGDAFAQVLPGRFHAMTGPLEIDASRYASINLVDEGQVWDILSQTGALLKAGGDPSGPLRGQAAQHLYLTGTSGSALVVLTYLGDRFDERHRLDDGAPIFDGYLPYAAHGSLTYYRIASPPRGINGVGELTPHPSEQIPFDDPRRTVAGHDVPVIQVVTETEVIVPLGGVPAEDLMLNMYNNNLPVEQRLAYRRADSDDPTDLFRLYEIAGAAHDGSLAESTQLMLGLERQPTIRMGRPRDPVSDLPVKYSLSAAFDLLHAWAAQGKVPPRADRIEVDLETASVVRDDDGNAVGGVRTPYLDVPIASYRGVNPGAALMGTKIPFTREQFLSRYGSDQDYRNALAQRTYELAAQGWLRPSDVDDILSRPEVAAPSE